MRALVGALRTAWVLLRQVSGDAAYETYVARARGRPMSPEAFWLDTLRRRYERPQRCC